MPIIKHKISITLGESASAVPTKLKNDTAKVISIKRLFSIKSANGTKKNNPKA